MYRSSIVVAAVVACVATCEASPALRQGNRGPEVEALQRLLVSQGHAIAADGIYGPKTAAAVRAFQRSRSLPGTGRVDASTRRALERPLQRGDRGAGVQALQRELNRLGAGLRVDGIFGARTENAVREALRSGHELNARGGSASPSADRGADARSVPRSVQQQRPAATGYPSTAPRDLIAEAERVLRSNPSGYRQDVFVIVDLRLPSSQPRFFVVEPGSGRVTSYMTSHGSGSDPRNSGRAVRFSNTTNSHMTSVGVYRTAETYSGKHGYSLRLDGLSGTNSRARARAIVIHGASYVTSRSAGRSWGCFALEQRHRTAVIDQIKGGALLYAPNPSR